MNPHPVVLTSLGPVNDVEVERGRNEMPAGYHEVEVRFGIGKQSTAVHIVLSQEALEKLVRGLRSMKNSKGAKA